MFKGLLWRTVRCGTAAGNRWSGRVIVALGRSYWVSRIVAQSTFRIVTKPRSQMNHNKDVSIYFKYDGKKILRIISLIGFEFLKDRCGCWVENALKGREQSKGRQTVAHQSNLHTAGF